MLLAPVQAAESPGDQTCAHTPSRKITQAEEIQEASALKLSGKEITEDLGDRKHERTTLAHLRTKPTRATTPSQGLRPNPAQISGEETMMKTDLDRNSK
jgi:hypothetical protein